MKNIFKQILIPCILIACLIFLAAYGTKINFGESWFKDSLPNGIVPNKSIRMQPNDSLYYNGVVVTSGTGGGGIAASDNTTFSGNNTFTNGTTFSDSLRANGYSLIDDAKITSYLRVTGEVTTDLNFNKGSSTSIGTISTDSLAFITNNTKRIIIDKNGYTTFTDTVSALDYMQVSGNLSVGTNITALGNITADSIAGIGAFITDVNAITLKGQDTTHFARLDTLTTEKNKAQNIFSDVATFWKAVTFTVSPVFSALVNFANGITVNGIATFNGDMINNGWKKIGSAHTQYQYTKDTVLKMVLNATSGVAFTDTIRHGIANWRSIVFTQFIVHEDSANINCIIGLYANDAASTSLYGAQAWTDSLFARVRLPGGNGNSTAWRGDTCTVYIKYTDYNR